MQESFNLESPNYEKPQKLTIPNLHNSYDGASSKLTRTLCLATGNCCLEWLLSHMELSQRAGNIPWAWINIREMPSHKQAKAFANTAVALHVHTYLIDYKNYSYLPFLAVPFYSNNHSHTTLCISVHPHPHLSPISGTLAQWLLDSCLYIHPFLRWVPPHFLP